MTDDIKVGNWVRAHILDKFMDTGIIFGPIVRVDHQLNRYWVRDMFHSRGFEWWLPDPMTFDSVEIIEVEP
jgi:hypothetical protein